jgi:hypothetical protein
MSNSVEISGPIAYTTGSGSAIFFSKANSSAGSFNTQRGTAVPVQKVQAALDVAYWGEDNRFPQNIEQQMAYCGLGKQALNWAANALYGAGIVPGKIVDKVATKTKDPETGKETTNDDGGEVFEPLNRSQYKHVYDFLNQMGQFRFWMEYLQDWKWFGNCFPEIILSKDGSSITGFVHQESCDSRYKQMNKQGVIDTVYLSKLWGSSSSQFAKFDPEKSILGILENPKIIDTNVDSYLLKRLDCIDMYDPVNSLKAIAEKIKSSSGLKSAILPTNYPSVNKTYYQVPAWDGARLGGWVEIACKQPQIFKQFLKKGAKLQYHIEVPETYFEKKFGAAEWKGMGAKKQNEARKKLAKEMDDFLANEKNAYSNFLSFFDIDRHNKEEVGRMKITQIDNKSGLDKEIILTSAAANELLTAFGLHPTLIGASMFGSGQQRTGGSDQREAYLIYTSSIYLERRLMLEPLYLARDFNQWGTDIEFRIKDVELTTLDKNTGSVKKLS